jgi:MFS family permease
LVDRSFGALFWGKLISQVAAWALMIVVVNLAYEATGSASWAGAMAAAHAGPQLVLALLSGRLSDTYGPVSQIVTGSLLCGISAWGLVGWLWWVESEASSTSPIPLLIASLVYGCGMALSAPAMHSIVPRLVTPEELSSAVALNFFPTALARTAGPAGGALLAAVFGPAIRLAVVGSIFLASSAAFVTIRSVSTSRDRDARTNTVMARLRYVFGDRVLALLGGVAAVGFGSEPAITLAPALAELIGRSGHDGGLVTSCFGAGGLLGVVAHRLLSRWFMPSIEGCIAMVLLALSIAAAGCSPNLPVLCCALAVAGISMVVGITALSVAVQQRCDEVMLGRVMALWVLAFAGIRPLAGVVQGFFADTFSTRSAILSTAGLCITVAALVWLAVRSERLNEPLGKA